MKGKRSLSVFFVLALLASLPAGAARAQEIALRAATVDLVAPGGSAVDTPQGAPWQAPTRQGAPPPQDGLPSATGGGPTLGGDVLLSMPRANQFDPAVAYHAYDREFLVVWTDDRDRAVSGLNIYGQRFSEAGAPIGEAFFVTNAAGDQIRPDVAYNHGFDEYLVVWEDCRKGPDDCDIIGRRVSEAGAPVGGEIAISTAAGRQQAPAVASGGHTFKHLVVWQDDRYEAAGWDIWGQLVGIEGNLDGSNAWMISDTDDQLNPDVTFNDTDDRYVVAGEWRFLDRSDVVVTRVTASGNTLGDELRVVSSFEHELNTAPAIAWSAATNELIIAYQYHPGLITATAADIRARIINADLTVHHSPTIVVSAIGNQMQPAVAANGTYSEYLITWQEGRFRGVSGWDIYGKLIDRDGLPVGRGEFPISRATDDQFLPVVAFTPPAQQYAVFWADGRTGQFTHIFGQRLSRTGLPAGYGFGAVGAPGAQEDPAVAYNSVEEDYLAVWADERGADPDIYGQRYTAEGRLLGDNFIIYQATGEQIRPAVAFNSLDDSYLVVWEDVAAGAIMGRIMGPQGNPLAAPFTVSTGTAPRHWPRVAYNSNPAHDNYLVVFECDNPFDPPDESGVDFCRRLVSAAGVPEAGEPRAYRDGDDLRPAAVYNPDDNQYLVVRTVGHYATAMVWAERIDAHGDWMPGTGVEVTSPGVKTWAPGVAYNSADNEYLVFWTEYTSAGDVLRARIMGADESLPGLVFMISSGSTLADDSVGAGLYFPAANRYRVVWDDPRTPESAWDIWGQWVEADGATSAETELPVFRTTGWQRNPDIAFGLQDGDAFTVWQDGRNGVASDVYGRLGALDHTPPVAAFTASPAVGVAGAPFTFDASPSRDNLTPPGALEVRWDFQNDGVWDTEFAAQKMITHTYALQGARTVALQARDWAALTGVVTHTIGVLPQAAGAAAAPAANPPVARLTVTPDHAEAGAIFTADASASTGVGTLRVRWDWENDGNFDTGFSTNLIATHAYTVSDDYVIRAELLDGTGLTAAALRIVTVLPGDPVSLLVRPAAVRLIPGQTVRFRAAAWDLYGNRLWNPEVEWSLAAPAAGKLDDAGWFTAGLRAGLYPDAVAATLGPLTARAAVRVFWPQRLHLPLVRR